MLHAPESIYNIDSLNTSKDKDNKFLDFSAYEETNNILKTLREEERYKQNQELSRINYDNIIDNAYIPIDSLIHYPTKKYEVSWDIDNINKQQKLKSYWVLANLAYSDLKTNEKWKIEIASVKLDVLSFPNIDKIFNTPKPNNLTAEEEVLYSYIQNNINDINNTTEDIYIVDDIQDILKLANIKDWLVDDWYRYTISNHIQSDTSLYSFNKTSEIISKEKKKQLLINWLKEIKKQKLLENRNILEQLEWEFEVLDYYPKDLDKDDSWFWAMFLEDKNWKKYISIRWTEITDWWDLWSDMNLVFSRVPEWQTKDMIDFMERILKSLWPNEKIRVIWHSLWWALSQILTSMYPDKVKETYTFNSPWA